MSSLLHQYFFIANQATTTFFSNRSISVSSFKQLSHCLRISLQFATIFFAIGFPAVVGAIEDDVECLKGVKASLKDPDGNLGSWDFSNTTVGFICRFVGGTCWNGVENRLVDLRLPSLGLVGDIPDSLQFCSSINNLDLSDNELTGGIPADICTWLPSLVSLDLSGNYLSGPIPVELFKCKYLNYLRLDNNSLSGTIPYQLSHLSRLKRLSVANNELHGEIPTFLSTSDPKYFTGNPGLCGHPLQNKCLLDHNGSSSWFYISATYGFLIGFWSVLVVLHHCKPWRIRYYRFIDKICSWLLERYALWILYLRDHGF